MKKILLFALAVWAFAFKTGHVYRCETLGVGYKDNNQSYEIPNNAKTQKQLKEMLKVLYTIKVKPNEKTLSVYVSDKKDELNYVKSLKKGVNVYKTKQSDLFVVTDSNTSQIGLQIPSEKIMIFYQCK